MKPDDSQWWPLKERSQKERRRRSDVNWKDYNLYFIKTEPVILFDKCDIQNSTLHIEQWNIPYTNEVLYFINTYAFMGQHRAYSLAETFFYIVYSKAAVDIEARKTKIFHWREELDDPLYFLIYYTQFQPKHFIGCILNVSFVAGIFFLKKFFSNLMIISVKKQLSHWGYTKQRTSAVPKPT